MVFSNQSMAYSGTQEGELVFIFGRSGSVTDNVTDTGARPRISHSSDTQNFQLHYSHTAEVFIMRFGTKFVAPYIIS